MTGGDDLQGTANLFAPIQPPKIKSISRKDIQSFLTVSAAYEHSVEAHPGMKPVPYRSCFDADYLEAILMAEGLGEDIDDASKCTDEVLKAKLSEMLGVTQPADYKPALAEVKKHMRMKSAEDDARKRILMLNIDYLKFCKKRGWDFHKNFQKAAVKHICAVIQPPDLKIRIESALKLEKEQLKRDYKGFMKFLADEAELCERYNPLRKYRASATKPNPDAGKGVPSKPSSVSTGTNSKPGNPGKPTTEQTTKQPKNGPPCLVTGCKENHFIPEHRPQIPESEQKRLVDEFKKKKAEADKSKKIASVRDSEK